MRTRPLFFVTLTMAAAAIVLSAQTTDTKPPASRAALGAWDAAIVKRAAQLLDTPEKWNRADTSDCPAHAKTFSIACALEAAGDEAVARVDAPGALVDCAFQVAGETREGSCGVLFDEAPILTVKRVAAPTTGKWRADANPTSAWAGTMAAAETAVLTGARSLVDVVAPKKYKARLIDYNNDPAITFADVKKFFELLEERVATEAATYLEDESDAVEIEAYSDGTGTIRTYRGWYPVTGFAEKDGTLRFRMDRHHQVPPNDLDRQIIERARAMFTSDAVWNRADNRKCPAGAPTVSIYCAEERATIEVTGGFHHRRPALELVRVIVEDRSKDKNYPHRLMGYNNDPATTLEDVRTLFAAALATIK